MSILENNIVVAAGNNGNKGGHKRIDLNIENQNTVEFVVGESETVLNINIWPNFADIFSITIVDPSNNSSQSISVENSEVSNNIRGTLITGVFMKSCLIQFKEE